MESSPAHLMLYQTAHLRDPRTHLRLLRFHRRTRHWASGDYLSFDLALHEMVLLPKYQAVWYDWTTGTRQETIFVNSITLKVQKNCYYALWQLWRSGAECVWIDSICIDQHNDDEKSGQVAIMFEIYHYASQVFACGESSDKCSNRVIRGLPNVDRIPEGSNRGYGEINKMVFQQMCWKWMLVQGDNYCTQLCED
ncbi:hypothetical protein DOTSEDRAFT_72421 [Dothistroma septosporum NZE10]|uniref:Heterokaryon incompatibility domain-containing protein n=1 Tax=Dothistroma septosporum (strain NZE10 / CBS 128990) TaxID=675120 RepID=M2WLU5_DOTSN|nr:hypothetical protein DOTSEDRAFT_72421 [Dothistroma septosporum NZE10]